VEQLKFLKQNKVAKFIAIAVLVALAAFCFSQFMAEMSAIYS
jgi:hypothetical protein